ncbi:unnamed protein product [Anisakis simplex]|uniref:Small muscular protein n=1 Tax=Anisakis simplex TaxID=6269 RepID=A0A0M3KDW5_ANISI|nr:unnamed protein product [Anisakis simplex]
MAPEPESEPGAFWNRGDLEYPPVRVGKLPGQTGRVGQKVTNKHNMSEVKGQRSPKVTKQATTIHAPKYEGSPKPLNS